jgi:ankyrin repeat protein
MEPFQADPTISPVEPLNFEALKTQVVEYLKQNPAWQEPGTQDLNCSSELYTSLLKQLNRRKAALRLSSLKDFLFLHEFHSETEFLSLVRALHQPTKDHYLLMAMKHSKVEIIPVLINEGANYCQMLRDDNLLTIALEKDWDKVLEALYEKNLSLLPEAWEENLETPLQIALRRRNNAGFEAILKNLKQYLSPEKFLATLRIEDGRGDNLCSYILRHGSEKTIDLLIQAGAASIFAQKNSLGKTGLHLAAHADKLNMLQKFLDVTEPSLLLVSNAYQQTPLESAVHSVKNEAVELLMGAYKKNGFSLAIPLNTAYSVAVTRKQITWILRLLVLDEKNEIALNHANNGLALAMTHANFPLICELIKRGANLEALTPQGTILHYALKNNWLPVLEALSNRSDEDLKTLLKSRTAENKSPSEVAHPDVDPGMLQKLQALAKNPAEQECQGFSRKKVKY